MTADRYRSPSEAELARQLSALVAAGELTESGAAQMMPGYEYPELLTWVHDPLDRIQVPAMDAVAAMAEQVRTRQAQQAAVEAPQAAAGTPQGYPGTVTRIGGTGDLLMHRAPDDADDDADVDGT